MEYRTLGRSGITVSEIGLGCEHLQGKTYSVINATINEAFSHGINFFDVFMSEPDVRRNIGKSLKGRREKAVLQGHIGAIWKNDQYAVSRDLNECKASFEDLLVRLGTNYIDIGMIHCLDSAEDFDCVFDGEIIRYVKNLKEQGVIKAIGLATHNATTARRAAETGIIDVLMFSINPAFDLMPADMPFEDMAEKETASIAIQNNIDPNRTALYQYCEHNEIAITVMKPYMAGLLLSAEQSPFGWALSPSQCIHYALTRPAVASAFVGCISHDEIKKAVAYGNATAEEKDFSAVFEGKIDSAGKCVYCNHCLPCPVFIDIAQVNKYLDLAQATQETPDTVVAHYHALTKTAKDCIACGLCEKRCPFGVQVVQRMKEAARIFTA
jgi:predicted aldo/keto reductase-like oxidoreductase